MSDTFVVVSGAGDGDYEAAVVFNNSHKDADNESAANEYAGELRSQRPWQTHSVLTGEDFKSAYPEKTDAPADPSPVTEH